MPVLTGMRSTFDLPPRRRRLSEDGRSVDRREIM
jgi:hypothetical protein